MHPEERAYLIRLLEDSQAEFLDLVSALTAAQWTCRPARDGWSVSQTAQHIALSESLLLFTVKKTLAAPPDPDWEARTAGKDRLVEQLLRNPYKATAPEPLRPSKAWACEETIARFKQRRAKTLQFAAETDAPLKSHVSEHPFPAFGALNAHQWLLYIPLHHMRHNRQIAELIR